MLSKNNSTNNLRASTTTSNAVLSGGNLSGSPRTSSKKRLTRRRSSNKSLLHDDDDQEQQQPDDFSHIHLMDASQGDHLSEIDNLSYRFELEQNLGASIMDRRQRDANDFGDCDHKSCHSANPMTAARGDDDDDDDDDDASSVASSRVGADVKNMAQYETQNVTRWKTFVMFLLLVNAALVIVSTFEFMRRSEEEDFENGFNRAAKTVTDAIHYHANGMLDNLDQFSMSVTSYTLDTGAKWPLVTMPHFEHRASLMRHESFLMVFGMVPFVRPHERKAWEAYSSYKQSWLQESYATVAQMALLDEQQQHAQTNNETRPSSVEDIYEATPITPTIHQGAFDAFDNVLPTESTGPYAPIWQLSPPPPPDMMNVINADMLSSQHMLSLIQALYENQHMSVSRAGHYDLYNASVHDKFFGGSPRSTALWLNSTTVDYKPGHSPKSVILQPIFDSFDVSKRNMRAFSWGILPWDHLFMDLLPAEMANDRIIAVLENSCGQVMTFAVDGPDAAFVGPGDVHESKFDHLVVETELEEFWSNGKTANAAATTTDGVSDENNNDGGITITGNEQVSKQAEEQQYDKGHCSYTLRIYPSSQFRSAYITKRPEYFTCGIALIFLVTGVSFFIFVYVSRNRQKKVMVLAMSTGSIVASMFPENVRGRILQDAEERALRQLEEGKIERKGKGKHGSLRSSVRTNRGSSKKSMMYRSSRRIAEETEDEIPKDSNPSPESFLRNMTRPIADLYPDVTIMIADIVGFTAWASVREPHQVFILLETLYMTFDAIAKRRRVFKVETISDSYVACAGLPAPRGDHALLMARFARDCLAAVENLFKQLERSLGPDTGELTMRFGLDSGPVTAGVLRGNRARYQVFGDTVNMASRMESNCEPGRIQISQNTAEILAASKKSSWFTPREDKVVAKGKGEVLTYWLNPLRDENTNKSDGTSVSSGSLPNEWLEMPEGLVAPANAGSDTLRAHLSEQNQRLAEWNSNQLLTLLNRVVAKRKAEKEKLGSAQDIVAKQNAEKEKLGSEKDENLVAEMCSQRWAVGSEKKIIDEVQECIPMPDFDPDTFPKHLDCDKSELTEAAIQQLHDYVSIICSMYDKSNPFHSYQKASHATMNVVKLLSRMITSPQTNGKSKESSDAELYEKSFGIAADPLAQFSITFAALIHDVDHPGITNSQHVLEGSRLARLYNYTSVNQQNSFTVAWDLLSDPMFDDLRQTIFTTQEEYDRFRAFVINAILATDICNERANIARNMRWDMVFHSEERNGKLKYDSNSVATGSTHSSSNSDKRKTDMDLKATLLLEFIMQASDVCHVGQHWHMFYKWNERNFNEKCRAYQQGRASQNPADYWYTRQLDFFDSFAIPLAQKLKNADAFGSYADDYLNSAKKNRGEWFRKGSAIVRTMEQNFAEQNNDTAPKAVSRGMFRSRSQDSIVPTLGEISNGSRIKRRVSGDTVPSMSEFSNGSRLKRRVSVDTAPRTPGRSFSSHDLMDPAKVVAEMFAHLPDFSRDGLPKHPKCSYPPLGYGEDPQAVTDLYPEMPDFRRRASDEPPQHPRRSIDTADISLSSKLIEEMFADKAPAQGRRKSGDVMPHYPRRSRDEVDLSEDAKAVQEMFAGASPQFDPRASDTAPRNPSRSMDNVDMDAFLEEVFERSATSMNPSVTQEPTRRTSVISNQSQSTAMDTSCGMSRSFNTSSMSHSGDTTRMGANNGVRCDSSARPPIRRHYSFDESTVHTMERIPEVKPSISSDNNDIADGGMDRSLVDSSGIGSLLSDDDESTILTMGNLWNSANAHDLGMDDSTVLTHSVA